MVTELNHIYKSALIDLFVGVDAVRQAPSDDEVMNRLHHDYEYVAWDGWRWMLTDKGREAGDAYTTGGKIERQFERIAALEAENAALKAQNAELRQRNGALALIADQATKEQDALRGLVRDTLQELYGIAGVLEFRIKEALKQK